MNRVFEGAYRGITDALPPRLAARIDLLRPSLKHAGGGPLNGQERRREIVKELAGCMAYDRVLEAGTYRGTTTEFLTAAFGAPVTTVEVNPRYYAYTKRRLAHLPGLTLLLADSRQVLAELAERPQAQDESCFTYLAGRGGTELALGVELESIAAGGNRAVVLIDGFWSPTIRGTPTRTTTAGSWRVPRTACRSPPSRVGRSCTPPRRPVKRPAPNAAAASCCRRR